MSKWDPIRFDFHPIMVKKLTAKSIQLADQFTKALDRAVVKSKDKPWIAELKSKARLLVALLLQFSSSDHVPAVGTYDRPVRRVMESLEDFIGMALSQLLKYYFPRCIIRATMKRFSTQVSFRAMARNLGFEIDNVSWLIRVRRPAVDICDWVGVPPVASHGPIVVLLWSHIATLHNNRDDYSQRQLVSDAAEQLYLLARDSNVYCTEIIEEGGVEPLLKLIEFGPMEAQEKAAWAIGILSCAWTSVQHSHQASVCQMFVNILREGQPRVQAVIARLVSFFAEKHPKNKDFFVQHYVVRLLVDHLVFETAQLPNEHASGKIKDFQDYFAPWKFEMKEEAARALCTLAEGNTAICRSVAEPRALSCFTLLLEKGSKKAQMRSASALNLITEMLEKDDELRRSVFDPNSPVWKSVVDHLVLKITDEKAHSANLVWCCIEALGNLAKTFDAAETRIISQLVHLLKETKCQFIARHATIALTKFVCTDNNFHFLHSQATLSAGIAKHLIQLMYFLDWETWVPALVLISYIALHVPESDDLPQSEVLTALKWVSEQSFMMEYDKKLDTFCYTALHAPDSRELAWNDWHTDAFELESRSYMTQGEPLTMLLQKAKSKLEYFHRSAA